MYDIVSISASYNFMYSLLMNHIAYLFAGGSFVMPVDIENHAFLLKVICVFFCTSVKGVFEAGDQTMGHETGATMKVMCFNPGSRLKEKSQDAALNH